MCSACALTCALRVVAGCAPAPLGADAGPTDAPVDAAACVDPLPLIVELGTGATADRFAAFVTGASAGTLQPLLDAAGSPGGALAVLERGQLVGLATFGLADRARCLPVSRATVFTSAAGSQLVTLLAALAAFEEGSVSLDTDLATAIPDLRLDPGDASSITLNDLLAFTSGIERYRTRGTCDERSLAGWLAERPLAAWLPPRVASPPGHEFDEVQLALVGRAIEHGAGASFEAYASERIIARGGLRGVYDVAAAVAEGRPVAVGFDAVASRTIDPRVAAPCVRRGPSNGLFADVDGLIAVAEILTNRGARADGTPVVSPTTIDALTTPQDAWPAEARRDVGLGVEILAPPGGGRYLFTTGNRESGFTSEVAAELGGSGRAIVFLANSSGRGEVAIPIAVEDALFGAWAAADYEWTNVADVERRYVGRYTSAPFPIDDPTAVVSGVMEVEITGAQIVGRRAVLSAEVAVGATRVTFSCADPTRPSDPCLQPGNIIDSFSAPFAGVRVEVQFWPDETGIARAATVGVFPALHRVDP